MCPISCRSTLLARWLSRLSQEKTAEFDIIIPPDPIEKYAQMLSLESWAPVQQVPLPLGMLQRLRNVASHISRKTKPFIAFCVNRSEDVICRRMFRALVIETNVLSVRVDKLRLDWGGADAVIGTLGGGGEDDDKQDDSSGGGYTMQEVAKRNKNSDVWVVLNGLVLNVSQHPGAVGHTNLCREGCRCRFRHDPLDVDEKYLPDAVIGVVGGGKAEMVSGAAFDDTPGVVLVNIRSYDNACYYSILSIIYKTGATTFPVLNCKISDDRSGLTRSAVFLIFFIVVHAVGNLHVFKVRFWWSVCGLSRSVSFLCFFLLFCFCILYDPEGPDDFNGYGHLLDRLQFPGEHLRGIRVVERSVAHLRRFETSLESEAAFCVDERPTEFGHHWINGAHVHDHSPLPVPIRWHWTIFLDASTDAHQFAAKLVDHPDVLLDQR